MTEGTRFRVVIAGAGVASLEAALALRALLGDRIELELIAPDREFFLRPLAVAEPFGYEPPRSVPLADVAGDLRLLHRQTTLQSVAASERSLRTASGEEVGYDALLLAIGASPRIAVPGATLYRGAPDNDSVRALLAEAEAGAVSRLVFAVPASIQWPLPMYELALMTAAHLRAKGRAGVRLTIATHEPAPLTMFGRSVGLRVSELLRSAGIELLVDAGVRSAGDGGLLLSNGVSVEADRVIAPPRLTVGPIPGIPQGRDGLIGTDLEMRVEGTPRVWAAGDATWFPIKQGGVAAQQADVAARSIAALVEPDVLRRRFRPSFRGVLLTGGAPLYMRAEQGDRSGTSAAGAEALWWPPAKVAGPHLASYMSRRGRGRFAELEDLEPVDDEDPARAEQDYREVLELALKAADASAGWRDFAGAARWLEVAEDISLALPAEYAEKRRRWAEAERAQAAAAATGGSGGAFG